MPTDVNRRTAWRKGQLSGCLGIGFQILLLHYACFAAGLYDLLTVKLHKETSEVFFKIKLLFFWILWPYKHVFFYDDDVSFYNSTASSLTLATPRTSWESWEFYNKNNWFSGWPERYFGSDGSTGQLQLSLVKADTVKPDFRSTRPGSDRPKINQHHYYPG